MPTSRNLAKRFTKETNKVVLGIDLDNTLIEYDGLFSVLAEEADWLSPASKKLSKHSLREHLHSLPNGEKKWQALQGMAYGHRMEEARWSPGAEQFLVSCREMGFTVFVVSHKTEYATCDPTRTNLREAALNWLGNRGFFDAARLGIRRQNIFFEQSRDDKVRRIADLGCTHFIDDLIEVFAHSNFPASINRLLYAPGGGPRTDNANGEIAETFGHWNEISEAILGRNKY